MKRTAFRFLPKVIKAKQAAEKFTADVTGLDEMVLYTWGTVDGTADDQAVWANARLIATDGSSVWLNDLKDTLRIPVQAARSLTPMPKAFRSL